MKWYRCRCHDDALDADVYVCDAAAADAAEWVRDLSTLWTGRGDQDAAGAAPVITDPNDPRQFRLWVTLSPTGRVRSTNEFEAAVETPGPQFVEVTAIGLANYADVQIDAGLVKTWTDAQDDVVQAQLALASARGAQQNATAAIVDAIAIVVGKPMTQ